MVESFDCENGFNGASSSKQMADSALTNSKISTKKMVDKPVLQAET